MILIKLAKENHFQIMSIQKFNHARRIINQKVSKGNHIRVQLYNFKITHWRNTFIMGLNPVISLLHH